VEVDRVFQLVVNATETQQFDLAKVIMELLKRKGVFMQLDKPEFFVPGSQSAGEIYPTKSCSCVLTGFFLACTDMYIRTLLVFHMKRRTSQQRDKAYGSDKDKHSFLARKKRKYGCDADDEAPRPAPATSTDPAAANYVPVEIDFEELKASQIAAGYTQEYYDELLLNLEFLKPIP
jgi:hypothetical protein